MMTIRHLSIRCGAVVRHLLHSAMATVRSQQASCYHIGLFL